MEESNRVLIVDDRPDIRLFLRDFLYAEGFSTLEAADADQATRLAHAHHPALILMDIMMPGRDGLSAVQEIRADDDTAGIIVMTAYGTEERAVRAMQVGADDYMRKPFDLAELHAKTHTVLEKYRLRVENRRLHERLQVILSHYMPPTVADRLIHAPGLPSLGGERQEVTLLFADLRGFTSFAAGAVPEDLLQHLNRYLTIATEAVLSENGTVDKFLGDGVMAIFNAPLRDTEHVFHAVQAAIKIQRDVEVLHQPQAAAEPLRFGVGIHTGQVVVGNIGAAQLMSYTAVGDNVNIAKRLEENAGPGEIIVSDSVVQALGRRILTRPAGSITVKGHTDPFSLFKVIALST